MPFGVHLASCLPLLILFAGCAQHQLAPGGKFNERALRRVEERTARLRELEIREPVQVEAYTRAQSAKWIEEHYAQGDPEANRLDDIVAHRLGILPDGMTLNALFSRALQQNAAGIYRPQERKLFIVTDILPGPFRVPLEALGFLTATDWTNEIVLSHEITHALQDQHFDLQRVLPSSLYRENADAALARKSIIESEAHIVSQAYAFGTDLQSTWERGLLISYLSLFSDLNVILTRWMTPGLPSFYAKLFVEQYTQGMRFIFRTVNRGGWKTLDRAYQDGFPRSTEQLLSPRKLTDEHRDEPWTFAPLEIVPTPAENTDDSQTEEGTSTPLRGWAHIESQVFGKLLWRIFFEDHVSRGRARRAAAGWGGDRYDVFEERKGEDPGRSLLIWRTVWDREDDAVEFFETYRAALAKRYPKRLQPRPARGGLKGVGLPPDAFLLYDVAPSPRTSPEPGVRTLFPEVALLSRRGARVLIVEGAPPDAWRAITKFSWAQAEPARGVWPKRGGRLVSAETPKSGETPTGDAGPKSGGELKSDGEQRSKDIPLDSSQPALSSSAEGGTIETHLGMGSRGSAAGSHRDGRRAEDRLHQRFHLPHHLAVIRMGAGWSQQLEAPGGDASDAFSLWIMDRELRWGFRPNLEWSPPWLLSLRLPLAGDGGEGVDVVLSGGLLSFALGPTAAGWRYLIQPTLGVTLRGHLWPGMQVIGQGLARAQLSNQQNVSNLMELVGAGSVTLSPWDLLRGPRTGFFGRWWGQGGLVLSAGMGVRRSVFSPADTLRILSRDSTLATSLPTVEVGAVIQRGAFSQPTLELRLLGRLFLYEASLLQLSSLDLSLLAQRHVGGLLLYF